MSISHFYTCIHTLGARSEYKYMCKHISMWICIYKCM